MVSEESVNQPSAAELPTVPVVELRLTTTVGTVLKLPPCKVSVVQGVRQPLGGIRKNRPCNSRARPRPEDGLPKSPR